MKTIFLLLVLALLITSCGENKQEGSGMSFKDDVEFLKKYTSIEILSDESEQAQIVVCPDLQGRVMTSTANGFSGKSFGWINYSFFEAGQNNPHFNPYGGEERIWLGPEGGQFSVYFKKGDPFDLDHWYTPAAFNEKAFSIVEKGDSFIHFRKTAKIKNYSDTKFDIEVNRIVRLLTAQTVAELLNTALANDLNVVAYQTENSITNTGEKEWTKETGLLSIWILGMFNPSPSTTIVLPFKAGPEKELGPIVNDVYFGKVPADRLKIEDNIIFFSADGTYRSKIGISPQRCVPFAGSYDADNKVLTIVNFSFDENETDYVNSLWEIQDEPYAGDVVNSYNDGPPAPGAKPMGPFYEIESSSAAAALQPGEANNHVHTTIHIQGSESQLDVIAKKVLGVGLEDMKNAFK